VRVLESLTSCLKGNKHIFCPEPWELHELVESGEPPSVQMSEHLERCPLCRQELEAYRLGDEEITLPANLAQEVRKEYGQEAPARSETEARLRVPGLRDRFSSFSRVSAAAVALAAAAVLAVVLIYPRGEMAPMVGMSLVSWGREDGEVLPKSPYATAKKPLVAMVLVFDGFPSQWPQARIDELYESLAPTPELEQAYDFVTPRDVSGVISGVTLTPDNRREVLDRLKNSLEVSETLFLEITRKDSSLELGGARVENLSGKTIQRIPAALVDETGLVSRLSGAERSLLRVRPEVE
jgi:hypothetical protein